MRLLCPNCHQAIDPDTLACPHGHQFGCEDGVLVLLGEEFGQKLRTFIANIQRFRAAERKRLLDSAVYEDLPFAKAVRTNWEWQRRGYDVVNIVRLLGARHRQTILDIGAWNGWLSHQLARRGHHVTALEYFTDPYDGLRAKKFYSTGWQAIQMDLTDLSVLDQQYEMVIINHGLHFFSDPIAHVAAAKQKVAPGGWLILLGLQVFSDPSARIKQVAAWQQDFQARYGANFFLNPTKGYLDLTDQARLQTLGVVLKPYPQLWRRNLKAFFKKTAPKHYYGVAAV